MIEWLENACYLLNTCALLLLQKAVKKFEKTEQLLEKKMKIKNRWSNCSRIWSSKMRRDFKMLRQFFRLRFKKNRSPLSQLFKQKWRVTCLSSLALYWTTGGPAGDGAWSDMNFICRALKHSNGLSNALVLPAKLDMRHKDPLYAPRAEMSPFKLIM